MVLVFVSSAFCYLILSNLFDRLFPSRHPTPTAGDWHPLVRTPGEQRVHARWLEQRVYLNWAGPYFKAYHYRKADISCDRGMRVQLLHEYGRQGAVLFYDPSMGPGNFRHFFEFLRDQVLALGYNLAAADQRTQQQERYIETVYKYFLKPQPTNCAQTGRCDQRFGNITVDLVAINGQPGFIRFLSNAFQDAIFTPGRSFDELLEATLNLPPADAEALASRQQYVKQ